MIPTKEENIDMKNTIKTVLFDLDGTLLPMDQDVFTSGYFKLLIKKAAPYGYEPEKLIKSIWRGTGAMVKNNGDRTNEEAFWREFTSLYGEKAERDKALFEEFYANDFKNAQHTCGYTPAAKECIEILKEKGLTAVLATNPIFPKTATEIRMKWAGVSPDDFALYTTYENVCFCKPNLNYYKDVLSRIGAKAEDCLMVGNDVDEDMVAENLGMSVFLLTDCMINKSGKDISGYPHGDFGDLKKLLRSL